MSKVALVTGASRGIGAAILDRLLEEGYFVAGTATSDGGRDAIQARVGDKGLGLTMDISDSGSIQSALEMLGEHGTPAILVNNAGITQDNLFMRMSEEEWTQVIETNLNGLYRVTKACVRGMIKSRWGRIINVGSVVGRMGNPGQANYAASKAGIEGFTRALALEIASRNITVNTIAPGFIATDMTNELTEEQKAAMLERIPAQRMGDVSDVAAAVAYLASEQAGYITAQTLQVNGGLYAA